MNTKNLNSLNYLDRMRLDNGIDRLKNFYRQLVKNAPEKAINLINERSLHFSSLFVLQDGIRGLGSDILLSSRNRNALQVTNGILSKNIPNMEYLLADYKRITYSTLKWILETGHNDDGLSKQYDEVLDLAAILLIKTYKDKTFLPTITDIIFKRNRKGAFIYDLAWAFFEACDPYSLILIADRLYSSHYKDIELACKLLNFVPGINTRNNTNYSCFINWFRENSLFLYYTAESFQQTFNPKPYAVSLEAKYLCKAVNAHNGKILYPLTKVERNLLDGFKCLNDSTRTLLSDCSYILHCQSLRRWKEWLHSPVTEQINVAGTMAGGIS